MTEKIKAEIEKTLYRIEQGPEHKYRDILTDFAEILLKTKWISIKDKKPIVLEDYWFLRSDKKIFHGFVSDCAGKIIFSKDDDDYFPNKKIIAFMPYVKPRPPEDE